MKSLRKIASSFQAAELDGELVMIHGETGRFFALKDVGLHVWELLDDDGDLEAVCRCLESVYDVDTDTCRETVRDFADQLVRAGFAEYF